MCIIDRLYIQWQLDRAPKDELRDNALESLAAMGKEALPQMLQELPHANEAGKEALLDVLSNFPGKDVYKRQALFGGSGGSLPAGTSHPGAGGILCDEYRTSGVHRRGWAGLGL